MVNKSMLLSAAVAGILSVGSIGSTLALAGDSAEGKFKCEQGNACKGKSDCHTATNSCAGANSCKGKGWVFTKDEAACNAMKAVKEKKKDAKKHS